MARFGGLSSKLESVRRRKRARYQACNSEVLMMKLALVERKTKPRKAQSR
ncbi:MAG: hypothetical protein JXA21_19325 [Anaerolineae bacterium]|nr:hypothetical protein [Anaerolineae bacterium]